MVKLHRKEIKRLFLRAYIEIKGAFKKFKYNLFYKFDTADYMHVTQMFFN